MINLTNKEHELYTILRDKKWYSYGISLIKRKIGINNTTELKEISTSLSDKINDNVNFFSYNNVRYVGLESRRLDYERDKKAGINKVEKLIAIGAYIK